ncbi:diguanylate cyclase [Planosporangium thailandense]|uniref:Diguanylate cyclase n=1 Tax=Planosporangium thailandense TaxID=765197 RepID=A0ABX0Y2H9_9ACTN|nr:tetratricopeptide repeat-containing diguanylate cyclase [Planosporangium thailandense]NJC71648.1 diguanylate cyclase [Planosporangium thailandense]
MQVTPVYAGEGTAALLAGLSARTPEVEDRLAAALRAMEMVPIAEFRTVAEPARRAERLAAEVGREDLRMRARLVRASVLLRDGDTTGSGRIAHDVHAWAAAHDDRYLLARSHHRLSAFFFHVGDLADALAHAVQSVAYTGDEVPDRMRAEHLMTLAIMLAENGSPDEARGRHREALDLATSIGDAELSLRIVNTMAYTAYTYGDIQEAGELVERMREFPERHGQPLAASELDTIARIEMMQGRYAEAEAALRPVLEGMAGLAPSEGHGLAECLLTVAEAQRLRGAIDAAQATLDRAVAVCEERGLASHRAQIRQEQAALYAATGRFREAYEEYVRFHAESQALQSAQREARARALQAVFETEEARRESIRFREMAQRDALTGLFNRRYVDEHLGGLIDSGTPVSVALVDLDYFKRVNDTLSHAAGDLVLQRVAELLAEAAGDGAVAARLGGEEFLLIFPDIDTDETVRRCEKMRRAIQGHPWRPITGDLPVTASIGVATVTGGRGSPSALLAQADRNLYAAKRAGRDRVVADPAAA